MPDKKPIKRETTLGEVVEKYPEAAMVMVNSGLHCIGCHMAAWETVEQGCAAHGMSDTEIDKLIEKMNKAAKKKK